MAVEAWCIVVTNPGWHTSERIEQERRLCEHCRGPCPKTTFRYFKPVVQDGVMRLEECLNFPRPTPYPFATLSDYDETPDNKFAVKIAKWYIDKEPDSWLYFFGGVGTGKTLLAAVTARFFENIIFGDVPSLLGEIKKTFDGDGSSREVIERYINCEMLVLDDLGAGQNTEWSTGVLYEIINARYVKNRRLIVTSNYSLDELEKVLKGLAGKRIVSRLRQKSAQAFLGNVDRRKNHG